MKFGICVHICPNFKSARAWQLQDCPFWIYIFDNCSQCLWYGVILSTRDMNLFCCRKLDSLKVALLGFYLDNRPRLPWRKFIYSAHHVHGWQSQAASHRELDSITSANLGLHLISTTASDACEEKYFIYRVHHLRGFLSQASSHRELDSLRLKFIYLLLASSVHQKTTELNNHMHGLLPVATSYRELESLTGASSCFWKFIILTPDFSLKKLHRLRIVRLVVTCSLHIESWTA